MKLVLETADGVRDLADSGEADAALVGVLPGDDIALHRLLLQESSAADRLEEARMRAIDMAAQPIEDLHVAVGPIEADGASWVAWIDRERMAGHLEHFRAAGANPRHLVPAALLLEAPDLRPTMARFDDDQLLLRTPDFAGLLEPGLAPPLTGTAFPPRLPQLPAFEPVLARDVPLDLLQGDFAPRAKWWKSRSFRILAAVLGLALLLALAAPTLITRARSAAGIAGYDQAVIELAAQTLGQRPGTAEDAAAALASARRAVEGAALGARFSFATAAVDAIPGARLDHATLHPDGELELTLGGPADAVNQLAARLKSGPYEAEGSGVAVSLGERRAGVVASNSELSRAMLRFVGARQDAAIVGVRKSVPPLPPRVVGEAFAAAGLGETRMAPNATGGVGISVPAARGTVLLPLIADLELKGARFRSADFARNEDSTLKTELGLQP